MKHWQSPGLAQGWTTVGLLRPNGDGLADLRSDNPATGRAVP